MLIIVKFTVNTSSINDVESDSIINAINNALDAPLQLQDSIVYNWAEDITIKVKD